MRILISFILIFFSTSIYSAPDNFFTKLMNEKVDRLSFGLYLCGLDLREDAIKFATRANISKSVDFDSCVYDFDNNLIVIRIIFKGEIDNENCRKYIKEHKLGTNWLEDGKSRYTYYFQPNGFSDSLSKTLFRLTSSSSKFRRVTSLKVT